MKRKLLKYGSIALVASFGLWSGSTAALHLEENRSLTSSQIELVKIKLPAFTTSINKKGHDTTFIRAQYSVSIPSKLQANPALTDMLSDALLRATLETFSTPSKEEIRIPHIAANRIANISNDLLNNELINELHVAELHVFKYKR